MFLGRLGLLSLAAPALFLSACGQGWEMKLTRDVSPYGNERTAGSGVMYVRAKLLPEKSVIMEPAPEIQDSQSMQEMSESQKMDKIFGAAQKK